MNPCTEIRRIIMGLGYEQLGTAGDGYNRQDFDSYTDRLRPLDSTWSEVTGKRLP